MRKNRITTLHFDGEKISKSDFRPRSRAVVNRPDIIEEYFSPSEWELNLWSERANSFEFENLEEYYRDKDFDEVRSFINSESFANFVIKLTK